MAEAGAETAPERMSGGAGGSSRRPRGRRTFGAGIAVVLAVLFIGLLAFGVAGQAPNSTIDDSLAQGRAARAPAFDLAILQRGDPGPVLQERLAHAFARGRLTVRDLRGTPVLLNIWASWCEPCRQEARLLERAWRTLGRPQRTLFLGLDQQDATTDALSFLRSYGVGYPNVRDSENDVPRSYGATGVPETFFISAHGQVVDHVIGVISLGQLREGLSTARTGRPLGLRSGGARRPSR